MSAPIDSRVVEMRFDNAAFERGVQQSTQSLQNLDKTITNVGSNSSKYGAMFGNLTNTLNKILPMDGLAKAASGVGNTISSIFSKTFDAIGTASKIGVGAISAMGASVTALAATGGMRRALNIEQAQFQLKGLGVAWEDIKNDINYAVEGTAYGLDAAAKAASQLVASGVQIGPNMKAALRGISGVAAMTNREYEDIANIFTTVASNGRLMTMQVRQLAASGLNVSAALGKQLGKTEQEINEMVTKGEIDFETFSKAMDDAFGEHATKANETFTGAMSNVKAALSRIGADFAGPYLENMRKVFVALIPVVNMIRSSLSPVVNAATKGMESLSNAVEKILEPLTKGKVRLDLFGNAIEEASASQKHLTHSFEVLLAIGKWFTTQFAIGFRYVGVALGNADISLESIISRVDAFVTAVRDFLYTLNIASAIKAGVADPIMKVAEGFKAVIDIIKEAVAANGTRVFMNLAKTVEYLGPIFTNIINVWNKFVAVLVSAAVPIVVTVTDLMKNLAEALYKFLSPDNDGTMPFFDNLAKGLDGISGLIPSVDMLKGAVDGLTSGFEWLLRTIGQLLPNMDDVQGIGDGIAQTFKSIFGFIKGLVEESGVLKELKEFFSNIRLFDILSVLNTAGILGAVKLLDNVMSTIKGSFTEIGQFKAVNLANLMGFGPALTELKNSLLAWQGALNAQIFAKIALALLAFAAALAVLTSINPDKLGVIAVSLAEFIGVMSVMTQLMQSLSMNKTQLLSSTVFFVGLSIAIGIMAAAFKKLSGISFDQLKSAALGLLAVVVAMSTVISVVGKVNEASALKGAATLGAMGTAFLLMAASMKLLSTIDEGGMQRAALGLLAVVVALSAIIGVLSAAAKSSTAGIAAGSLLFAALGPMMLMMGATMKILSSIDASGVQRSAMGLLAATAAISVLIMAVGHISPVNILAGTLAFAAMSGLLMSIATAFKLLSTIDMNGVLSASISLGATVAILGVAIAALGHMNPGKALQGTAALLGLAGSLALLAPALKLISTIPLAGVLATLVAVGGVVAILGAAAMIVPAPALLAVAAALTALGLAVVSFGAAATLLGIGVALIVAAVSELVAIAGQLVTAVVQMAHALVSFVVNAAKGFAENADTLVDSAATLVLKFMSGLLTVIPKAAEVAVKLIVEFVNTLASNIGMIVSSAVNLISNFLAGIASQLGAIIDSATWVGIMFIKGLADSIRFNAEFVGMAVMSLVQTIGSTLLGGLADILESNPVTKSLGEDIRNAADDLGAAAAEASSQIQAEFDQRYGEVVSGAGNMASETVAAVSDPGIYAPAGAAAAEGVASGYAGSSDLIVQSMGAVKEQVIGSMDEITAEAGTKGTEMGTEYSSGVGNTSDQIVHSLVDPAQSAVTQAGSIDSKSAGRTVGSNFGAGFFEGMDSWVGALQRKASDMATAAKASADNAIEAHSPARALIRTGKYFGQGFEIGIDRMIKPVVSTANKMAATARDSVGNFVQTTGSLLDGLDFDSSPVISPILDMTQVQAGLDTMNSLFAANSAPALGFSGLDPMSAYNLSRIGWGAPALAYQRAEQPRIDTESQSAPVYQLYINDAQINSTPEIKQVVYDVFGVIGNYGGLNHGE